MTTKSGITLIAEERGRQVSVEGWTPEHDDTHVEKEMNAAAVCYALSALRGPDYSRGTNWWPWSSCDFKPTTRIGDLIKAGALIAAEIDRLQRLGQKTMRACSGCGVAEGQVCKSTCPQFKARQDYLDEGGKTAKESVDMSTGTSTEEAAAKLRADGGFPCEFVLCSSFQGRYQLKVSGLQRDDAYRLHDLILKGSELYVQNKEKQQVEEATEKYKKILKKKEMPPKAVPPQKYTCCDRWEGDIHAPQCLTKLEQMGFNVNTKQEMKEKAILEAKLGYISDEPLPPMAEAEVCPTCEQEKPKPWKQRPDCGQQYGGPQIILDPAEDSLPENRPIVSSRKVIEDLKFAGEQLLRYIQDKEPTANFVLMPDALRQAKAWLKDRKPEIDTRKPEAETGESLYVFQPPVQVVPPTAPAADCGLCAGTGRLLVLDETVDPSCYRMMWCPCVHRHASSSSPSRSSDVEDRGPIEDTGPTQEDVRDERGSSSEASEEAYEWKTCAMNHEAEYHNRQDCRCGRKAQPCNVLCSGCRHRVTPDMGGLCPICDSQLLGLPEAT